MHDDFVEQITFTGRYHLKISSCCWFYKLVEDFLLQADSFLSDNFCKVVLHKKHDCYIHMELMSYVEDLKRKKKKENLVSHFVMSTKKR